MSLGDQLLVSLFQVINHIVDSLYNILFGTEIPSLCSIIKYNLSKFASNILTRISN